MNALSTPTRPLRRFCLAASLLPLLLGSLFAQSTGTITGRVYDERTGRSLEGAIVRAAGTAMLDYTTADGRYSLTVPAGPTTIEVEYVGLETLTRQVTVAADGSATFNAPLTSSIQQLESFIVQESVRGQALAINQQKIAAGIVNIVSEEMFGQMVDGNVGQALQRLPGISVNEDQDGSAGSINIRGISGDYNSVQIDGNRAPNGGLTGRAFNPRQLAADGVTNIEVIKAPTPDRDGDAIGGIINVVSRNAFQRDGREVRLRLAGVYSDLPEKWGHSGSLTYSDIYSIAGGEKNLGVSFTLSSHKTNRFSINADMDWIQVTPENNPQLNLAQYGGKPVWFMESSHWEYDTRVTNTQGLSGSIDFRTDQHNSFYIRPLYTHFDRKGIKFETDIDIDTRFQDASNGRKTYAFLTHDSGRGTPGTAGSQASRGWIGTDEDDENDLYSVSFGGRHEKGPHLLTYDLYYSRSENVVSNDTELNMLMEPTNPWFVFEYKIHDVAVGDVEIFEVNGVDPSDLSLMSEGELEIVTSKKVEDVYSARVDWESKFIRDRAAFAFKTGAKYRASKPRFDRTRDDYDMDEDFPYARVVAPTNQSLMLKPKYFDVYPRAGQELLRTNPELFTYDPNSSAQNSNVADYDAEEETSAAYVMGTLRFGAHTIIGGVRLEKNEWSSTRKDVQLVRGGAPVVTPINRGSSYTFWLPGIHFRHELRKNLILRESFNQSYGRANLAQLTRGRLVAINGNITDGNENLEPASSDNFDLQLEYYTANGGLYSAGVFYKDVKDFTYTAISRFTDLDANGNPIPVAGGAFQYSQPQNGSTAKNKGVELIARQRLYFLPSILKGFSAAVSATFTDTEATFANRPDDRDLPLPGFSKYLFTGTLEYARGSFFFRGDYRYRDDYVEGLGTNIESDEFYSAEERVDAEVGYRLRKGLTLFANGTNLTNRPQVSYQGYRPFVEDASLAGRKYTIGVEYSF